jgi:diguanylate cyclase (GGDEF)-like protein/PAS domain S-box-containing protein
VLAAAVCFLASAVAIRLFHRARVASGQARWVWLVLDAAAAGFGIWATHFIAMLAFDPGLGAGYDIPLTVLSLLIAILITGIGLWLAFAKADWMLGPALGGAVVGGGVAAMHYTGMMALDVPAVFVWSPALVMLSIALGVTFGSFALHIACWREVRGAALIATTLLTLAIVSMHFTGMGALLLVPDPTRVAGTMSVSPTALSLVVSATAAIVLGSCFAGAMGDRRASEKLQQQKRLLDAALANISQGLCMFGPDERVILFNERYRELSGLSASALPGRTLLEVLKRRYGPDKAKAIVEEVLVAVARGERTTRIVETSDGTTLRVIDSPMQSGGWVATIEDITEWQQVQAQIAHLAKHDPLTDLPNRTLFRERLNEALRRTNRGAEVAVFCLDLDRFKEVNDTLGHPIGDMLLKEVAQRLLACLRDGDTVARLGGDEFAIIQTGGELKLAQTSALAERVIENVSAPYSIEGHHVTIGATLGISLAPEDGTDPDQLLQNADLALYRSKNDGRGGYRFFEPGMDARALARRALELDLRAGIGRGEFEVHYQPLLDIQGSKIISFEALLRWKHPQRGLLLPNSFLSVAEETRLVIPIGEWVLRTACKDALRWPDDIRVAVNVSPTQFKNRNLLPSIKDAISSAGLDPGRLELEINETILIQDSDAVGTLHRLRALGVRIVMDDFGTGCSSLSYLRSFPFDKIKIDQSLVRDLVQGGESIAIVRAITGLGNDLQIATTAEGVETGEQLALLRQEGCTEVQGYLFSVAKPVTEIDRMLAKRTLRVVA